TFALSARVGLAGIVAVSAVVRTVAAQAHVTLYYFPDEYLYPALARGFAHGDGPVVRGAVVHFPALLEPLLTAPFWLFGDPELALVALAGLATFARVQYAALPVAFAVAALALDHRRAFSRYRLTWSLLALPVLGVLAIGPHAVLGAYAGVTSKHFHPLTLLRW